MTNVPYATPVLFLVFNRPDTTRKVLEAIRNARPQKLFVAADGPRDDHPRDAERCAEVLQIIEGAVDWECDVRYLKREKNLGCRIAVSAAISWFFQNVGEGVILEDDCLPVPQFFGFCSSLLAHFRDVPRVAHIGGFNCQNGRARGAGSYYFSRYFHVWGWASWRRAWDGYDVDMRDYPEFLASGALENLFERKSVRAFWKDIFDATAAGHVNAWDYQWAYRNFKDDRLAVIPNSSMIENIGFGENATHTSTRVRQDPVVDRAAPEEVTHPQFILPSRAADDFTYRHHLGLGRYHDLKHIAKKALGRV